MSSSCVVPASAPFCAPHTTLPLSSMIEPLSACSIVCCGADSLILASALLLVHGACTASAGQAPVPLCLLSSLSRLPVLFRCGLPPPRPRSHRVSASPALHSPSAETLCRYRAREQSAAAAARGAPPRTTHLRRQPFTAAVYCPLLRFTLSVKWNPSTGQISPQSDDSGRTFMLLERKIGITCFGAYKLTYVRPNQCSPQRPPLSLFGLEKSPSHYMLGTHCRACCF
jgi:hypothetical protein